VAFHVHSPPLSKASALTADNAAKSENLCWHSPSFSTDRLPEPKIAPHITSAVHALLLEKLVPNAEDVSNRNPCTIHAAEARVTTDMGT
jgi:hypothetical protein